MQVDPFSLSKLYHLSIKNGGSGTHIHCQKHLISISLPSPIFDIFLSHPPTSSHSARSSSAHSLSPLPASNSGQQTYRAKYRRSLSSVPLLALRYPRGAFQ